MRIVRSLVVVVVVAALGIGVCLAAAACGGSKEKYDPPPSYLDWAPEQKRSAAAEQKRSAAAERKRSSAAAPLEPPPEPVGSQETCTSGIRSVAEQCWNRGGSATSCADVELSLDASWQGKSKDVVEQICDDACAGRKAGKGFDAYWAQLSCVVGAKGPFMRLAEKSNL